MDIPKPIADLPQVLKLTDPAERAKGLIAALKAVPEFQQQLANARADAVNEMKTPGTTWAQVGEQLGVHWARAAQIAKGVSGGKKKPSKPTEE